MSPWHSMAFLGGAVGPSEILVVLAVALLLFGGRRLPEIARQFGRLSEALRRASDEFREQLMSAARDVEAEPPEEPDDTGAGPEPANESPPENKDSPAPAPPNPGAPRDLAG